MRSNPLGLKFAEDFSLGDRPRSSSQPSQLGTRLRLRVILAGHGGRLNLGVELVLSYATV
jgi:hypothetical protein